MKYKTKKTRSEILLEISPQKIHETAMNGNPIGAQIRNK